jgi:hypothetical protein
MHFKMPLLHIVVWRTLLPHTGSRPMAWCSIAALQASWHGEPCACRMCCRGLFISVSDIPLFHGFLFHRCSVLLCSLSWRNHGSFLLPEVCVCELHARAPLPTLLQLCTGWKRCASPCVVHRVVWCASRFPHGVAHPPMQRRPAHRAQHVSITPRPPPWLW